MQIGTISLEETTARGGGDLMAPIVQAKCPGCQKVLRVPADWVHKTMKCKHCGMLLHAKPAAASSPATAARTKTAPAPPPADDPESLFPLANDYGSIIRTPPRRRSGGR